MADSSPVFLDTAYLYALLNTRDQYHARAKELQSVLNRERRPLVTSEFVLTEMADGLSAIRFREETVRVIDALTDSSHVVIVPASSELYQAGLNLFRSRSDKQWGLTDCTSFVIMEQQDIQEALTTDDHFRQAGFRAMMLEV